MSRNVRLQNAPDIPLKMLLRAMTFLLQSLRAYQRSGSSGIGHHPSFGLATFVLYGDGRVSLDRHRRVDSWQAIPMVEQFDMPLPDVQARHCRLIPVQSCGATSISIMVISIMGFPGWR